MRYKKYEAAWVLMTYRGKKLLAPLADVHPGVVVVVAEDGGGGSSSITGRGRVGGVKDSPFPMPSEVLEKREEEEEEEKRKKKAAAAAELERSQTVVGALDDGAIYG